MTCVCVAKKSKLKEKAASQPPYGRFNPTSFMNPQLTGKHVHQSLTYAIDEQRINYWHLNIQKNHIIKPTL